MIHTANSKDQGLTATNDSEIYNTKVLRCENFNSHIDLGKSYQTSRDENKNTVHIAKD